MFERFTERARQVVVLAQEEARALGHGYIGTEHLLLGLMREEEGLAARSLEDLGVRPDETRAEIRRIVGAGTPPPAGQIPFTPRTKKVLELALREALSLGHNYIGTEHILLAFVREGEGVGMRILHDKEIEPERVRGVVLEILSGPRPRRLRDMFATVPLTDNQLRAGLGVLRVRHRELAQVRGLLTGYDWLHSRVEVSVDDPAAGIEGTLQILRDRVQIDEGHTAGLDSGG